MRRTLAMAMAALMAAGLLGGSPAAAAAKPKPPAPPQSPQIPDDQPLPGYTFNNPPLTPAVIDGKPTRVLQGAHRHAAYMIEVPPDWNGELVLWAHGYAGNTPILSVSPPSLRQKLLDQGYAWAASSFYANGYDIKAGVLSTRDLALHFARLVRKPGRTYITGASMGGHIVGRSMEEYPGFYAAGLPICGVLGDQEQFDWLTGYTLVAQALAGIRAYPPTDEYQTVQVPQIKTALGLDDPALTDPEGRQLRAITVNMTGGPRPGTDGAFTQWKDFLLSRATPPPGPGLAEDPAQVATNLFDRYTPGSPVNINRQVQRIAPRNLLARYSPKLTEIPRITGRPSGPVLSLHNLGDLFVPFSMEQFYLQDAKRARRSHLVVQRAIRASGHCEFTPTELGTAWDDLVRWTTTGKRPAGDDVLRPGAADFGCKFSDRAAYDAGTGSRRQYPACP
ncbi:hypothetical protein DPM19_29460 [Actinomadura craniellae]|uniref:Phthalyl amidase n=1 Tax=Actinomadura craniellae TaxID=2231787 RepID=A0A365GY29_9ACTN|nr:hypothetical protein [Actinomadura craniellae]RAY11740.1 hypothetical protein DPM19_29460 [Actinomadura craniellae]